MVDKSTIRLVQSMLRGISGRIRGLVRRATLGSVNSDGDLPVAQVESHADDVDDDIELMESYGFASSPPSGCEGIALSVGGLREGTIGICFSDRGLRISISSGEVAVYHQNGANILMRNDGTIVVTPVGEGETPGQILLGSADAERGVARVDDEVNIPSLTALQNAISGWTPVANDGGAALKTALTSWLADDVQDGYIENGSAVTYSL